MKVEQKSAEAPGIAVKVVERDEPEGGRDELQTVAAIVAAVINQEGIAGRVLEKVVGGLAALPECLAPATGLVALGIRNTLRVLDALPPLPRRRRTAAQSKASEPHRGVEKIRITS